jgi:hypothetical protein
MRGIIMIHTLIDKINHFGDYSPEVRQRVLQQIGKKLIITDDMIERAIGNVPMALEGARKFLIKYREVFDKVSHLETHTYAPELNKLHFKDGSSYYVNNKFKIEDAVEFFVKTAKQ